MTNNSTDMHRRVTVITVENDVIEDGTWNPLLVKTLREYADYAEKTEGAGRFPQHFTSSGGDNLTVFSGTCIDSVELSQDEEPRQQQ